MKDQLNDLNAIPGEQIVVSSSDTTEDGSDLDPESSARWSRYFQAVLKGTDDEIRKSLSEMETALMDRFPELRNRYHVIALLEPHNSVDSNDLDGLFSSLRRENGERQKDVLLVLLSRGGSIEPAYQISKICKEFSKNKFVVVIPRHAKSAATLIALGADELHIGPLGQLGPIDPQLGGLPALGVSQALKSIASVAQQFPGSASMFAAYLKEILTVEQIGYCDRIAESAVHYAQRLLASKASTRDRAETIARKLVHEYKDHGFVIDHEEAREVLGASLIKEGTIELDLAEEIYDLFDRTNTILSNRKKKIIIAGDWQENVIVLEKKR